MGQWHNLAWIPMPLPLRALVRVGKPHIGPQCMCPPNQKQLFYFMQWEVTIWCVVIISYTCSTPIMLFQTPQYLVKKTVPFFRGREILDPADYAEYMYPFPDSLEVISDSPLAYNPPSSPIPGFPANPR